jgi:DNA repair photolyase
MKEAVDAGLSVYGLIGPIMSSLEGHESEMVDAVVATGVRSVCIDRLNVRPELGERISRMGIGPSEASVRTVRSLFIAAGLDVADAFGEGWHEQVL